MGNVYEAVTARIIAQLEQGTARWVKPWKAGGAADLPYNATSGRRYHEVNMLLLWDAALTRRYRCVVAHISAGQGAGRPGQERRACDLDCVRRKHGQGNRKG